MERSWKSPLCHMFPDRAACLLALTALLLQQSLTVGTFLVRVDVYLPLGIAGRRRRNLENKYRSCYWWNRTDAKIDERFELFIFFHTGVLERHATIN